MARKRRERKRRTDTWDYESKYDAANHLVTWLVAAEHTGLGSLKDIIRLVDNNFNEILNWFNSGMSNGVMEGINSVIQAVKKQGKRIQRLEKSPFDVLSQKFRSVLNNCGGYLIPQTERSSVEDKSKRQ